MEKPSKKGNSQGQTNTKRKIDNDDLKSHYKYKDRADTNVAMEYQEQNQSWTKDNHKEKETV